MYWTSSHVSSWLGWEKLGAISWQSESYKRQGRRPRPLVGLSSWQEGWKRASRRGYMLCASYEHITPVRRTGGFYSLMH